MSSAAIDMILDAFARHGDRHYGERVSQTAHALQCAELAAREGAGDAMVAASLLQATFNPMDLLFYAIAVYEGYKLARKPRAS